LLRQIIAADDIAGVFAFCRLRCFAAGCYGFFADAIFRCRCRRWLIFSPLSFSPLRHCQIAATLSFAISPLFSYCHYACFHDAIIIYFAIALPAPPYAFSFFTPPIC